MLPRIFLQLKSCLIINVDGEGIFLQNFILSEKIQAAQKRMFSKVRQMIQDKIHHQFEVLAFG